MKNENTKYTKEADKKMGYGKAGGEGVGGGGMAGREREEMGGGKGRKGRRMQKRRA